MKNVIPLLILGLLLSQCSPDNQSLSTNEFKNPSTVYRPLALWSWMNGFVDTSRVVYELEEMKAKGMRGGIIWDLGAISDPDKMIPAGPPFLGKESQQYLHTAFTKGHELGLDIGMAVSSSWNAGGAWIGPEDAVKELLATSQKVKGKGKNSIAIKAPQRQEGEVEYYSLISSIAVPSGNGTLGPEQISNAINLDPYTIDNRLIEWEVPEGEWMVFSFFSCNTLQPLVIPSPNSRGLMIDHLSYAATTNHFDSLFAKIPKDLLDNKLIRFMEIDSYEVDWMNDWSPELVTKFKEKYQYDPIPYLPLLAGYPAADSVLAQRFVNDYRILVSDMMVDGHFAQSVEIADRYGIQMVTEAGHGGWPRVDPLKALGHSHIPTGEYWNRQRFWVTKEAASAAHIYNLNLVASESLTGWQHWQHGPSDYKQLTDIAFCEGLNQVMFHTFAHNPAVAGLPGFTYHAGEHLNVNTTWWEMAKPFMDYLARCSYLLRQGMFVADACLYYGDEAPNLVPSKRIDPNIKTLFDELHCLHCGKPKPIYPGKVSGYDYDYMNAEILIRDLEVIDGKLVLPSGMSYRVMMIPDREDINPRVLAKIEKLVYEGAVIIGPKPLRSNSLENYPACDQEVMEVAGKIWGNCDGNHVTSHDYGAGRVYSGLNLMEVLEVMEIKKDLEIKGIDNSDMHIDYIHRATETEDIYFISNSLPQRESFTAVFRVDEKRKPQLWDPETGLIQRTVEYTATDSGIEMSFVMDALASRFVIFSEDKTTKNDKDLDVDLQFADRMDASSQNEMLDLSADWQLHFDSAWGGPESYLMSELVSWTETETEAVSFYSGKAIYQKSVSLTKAQLTRAKQAVLSFENIQETARLRVNGKDLGILWTPPYRLNIHGALKSGDNVIEVEVINTWNNRLVGDWRTPDQKQFTRTNIKNKFKNGQLLESGIVGKARLAMIQD